MVQLNPISRETRKALTQYAGPLQRMISDMANRECGSEPPQWAGTLDGGSVVVAGRDIAIGRHYVVAEFGSESQPVASEIAVANAVNTIVPRFEQEGDAIFAGQRPLKGSDGLRKLLQTSAGYKHHLRMGDVPLEPLGLSG